MSLPAGRADQRTTLSRDRDDVVGAALEAILTDVFVEQPTADTLDEAL